MKPDKARLWTDKRLIEMEKELTDIYSQAQTELTKKWNAYMERGKKRLSHLYEAAQSGEEAAKKAYEDALKNYTFQNDWYKDMVAQTTNQLANVNTKALNYINGRIPSIYMFNYNAIAADIKNIGIAFTLVNEDVVRRRILNGNIISHFKQLNYSKDIKWNTKQINSSVLQGILQGESVDKIAKRIQPIVNNNENAAMRNARTMVTQAENNGKLDSYKRLEAMGIVAKKVWIATPDDRTRESHLWLDGEQVDPDQEFSNGLRFPADPAGAPEEVYNCRCTMGTEIIGFKKSDGSISKVEYNAESTLHDEQIKEEKAERLESTKSASINILGKEFNENAIVSYIGKK